MDHKVSLTVRLASWSGGSGLAVRLFTALYSSAKRKRQDRLFDERMIYFNYQKIASEQGRGAPMLTGNADNFFKIIFNFL